MRETDFHLACSQSLHLPHINTQHSGAPRLLKQRKKFSFDYSRRLCHQCIEGLQTPINLVKKKKIIPKFYKLLKHKGIPNNLYKFVLKNHNKYMFTVSCLLPCALMKLGVSSLKMTTTAKLVSAK
jgi:hypothetical protein